MAHKAAATHKTAQKTHSSTPAELGLPISVASPTDLGRLIRESEDISDKLRQLEVRKAGSEVKMPQTSHLMDQIVALNKLNLLKAEDRTALQDFLNEVRAQAPVLHISFSTDPSPLFIEKLMTWLRREIHPLVMLTIGLQPNIGAGCMLRTTNKYFDMSLRQNFVNKHQLLIDKLIAGKIETPA